jgi:predicted neuraminidase
MQQGEDMKLQSRKTCDAQVAAFYGLLPHNKSEDTKSAAAEDNQKLPETEVWYP